VNQDVSVINAVIAAYDSLSPSEKLIANYILEHRNHVVSMTAREIAEASNTSTTTMSRFVRSLGFSSFAQLRYTLARNETDGAIASDSADAKSGLSMNRMDSFIDSVLKYKIEELSNTAAFMKTSKFAEAVDLIREANMTVFAGVGNTISVAQNAAFKLTQVGYLATAPSSSDGSSLMATTLTDRDCLVVISSSGFSKRLVTVMDNAIDSGTPTIMITDNEDSELAKRADILLKTASRDRMLARDLRFSQNSINFVIELLTLALFHSSNDADERVHLFEKAAGFDRNPDKSHT
jgi:DNA-binding MurR/RpiR family transcriptional regulator